MNTPNMQMQSKQREIEYVQVALLELLDLYFALQPHKMILILGTRRQPTRELEQNGLFLETLIAFF